MKQPLVTVRAALTGGIEYELFRVNMALQNKSYVDVFCFLSWIFSKDFFHWDLTNSECFKPTNVRSFLVLSVLLMSFWLLFWNVTITGSSTLLSTEVGLLLCFHYVWWDSVRADGRSPGCCRLSGCQVVPGGGPPEAVRGRRPRGGCM